MGVGKYIKSWFKGKTSKHQKIKGDQQPLKDSLMCFIIMFTADQKNHLQEKENFSHSTDSLSDYGPLINHIYITLPHYKLLTCAMDIELLADLFRP